MGSVAEASHTQPSSRGRASTGRPRILKVLEKAQQDGRPLNVSAPMVRYSKLPFRLLVRQYGADVIFTPMMLAHEFIRSPIARDADFTTHPLEFGSARDDNDDDDDDGHDGRQTAVIAQFASTSPEEFARAAELIAPWVDGVDLNCGCPQSWALREGIGCALQERPEDVARMVRAAKSRIGSGKSVSVKIRLHEDLSVTRRWVEMVQEVGGVDFITVHGRTRGQRSSTVPDYEAVRRVRGWVRVPMIANGDAFTLADVRRIADLTRAEGVMAARGLLENPAMFSSSSSSSSPSPSSSRACQRNDDEGEVPPPPPPGCVGDFLFWAVKCPIPFPLVLHHVSEMTARMPGMTKKARRELMECRDLLDLVDFVEERWGLDRR